MKPPCLPKTECWCTTRPNHPSCVEALPIENRILSGIVLILIIILIYKKVKNENTSHQ